MVAPQGRGLVWRYKGRIVALVLAVVLGANWAWQTTERRAQALAEGDRLVGSLTRSLEYHVTSSLRSVSSLLDEAVNRIDPGQWPQPHLEGWFHARLAGYPEVRAMLVVDAEGNRKGEVILPNGRPPLEPSPENLAGRDFFQKLKADPHGAAMVIGTPILRGPGEGCVPLARAVLDAEGGFAGIVVVGLDSASLRAKLETVAVEDAGGTALFRSDATFLARTPGHERWLGKVMPDSPVFRELIPQASSGVGHFIGRADGNDKIVAYRTFADYPLVAVIGVTESTVLHDWREQLFKEGIANAVVLVALLVLATLYDWRAEVSRRLMAELEQSHRELEHQVEERTAYLAASNAELAQFTFIASHDLQEPLRSVSSFLQLLERRYKGQLGPDADEYIAFAVNGAKRMSTLLNDVLAYSQIGSPNLLPGRCDTNALAREALASLGDLAGGEVRIGELPAVVAVPSQVYCLFQNLLGNALKYRSQERPAVVAVGASVVEDGWVRLAVTDNGVGIDPQYHERIFKIFQRLHRREDFAGTGVGLALCKKIVESAGGRLWVESRPGEGSTFYFTLPAAD